MAKPRIFISSTFYDLKQVRSDLDIFLESLGYEPVRNEEGDIPYGKESALEDYCYKEIKNVDILVSIIGGRFGSETRGGASSISQIELRTAIKENKQVYIFIEKNVAGEFETYLVNKDTDMKFRFVDDKRIYQFIEEVKGLGANNNIKSFEATHEITRYLKEQFAGLFQRFLEEQTRAKEISIIRNIEKTAETLNKLVTVLAAENKGPSEEINKILMLNHPLIDDLKRLLEIPYNFYIDGRVDLSQLLVARGFKEEDDLPFRDDTTWIKTTGKKTITLQISESIFESDGKLKYIKKSEWNPNWVQILYPPEPSDDDLPF